MLLALSEKEVIDVFSKAVHPLLFFPFGRRLEVLASADFALPGLV